MTTSTWAPYSFTFDAVDGTKEIRVTFDNDAIIDNVDRNLLVDKVVVGCPETMGTPPPPPPATCTAQTFEAESMARTTGTATSDGWNLSSNGSVSTSATLGDGATTIAVVAAGTAASRVWPHFVVSVDGQTIGDGYASSTTYREYAFPFTATAGTKTVRVTYDNDYSGRKGDRNLLVDKVSVRCP